MNVILKKEMTSAMSMLMERIKLHQNELHDWLTSYEGANELPLYSSVDIRDAGFKMAVVDTNIFPGGFNNICEHGLEDSIEFFKKAIYKRESQCKDILIIAEEHTRNTWYLENVRVIEQIIKNAGFNVKVATFLTVQPSFCEKMNFVELETATGKPIRIYCFNKILEEIQAGRENFDLIIMNNDLTTGVPDILKKLKFVSVKVFRIIGSTTKPWNNVAPTATQTNLPNAANNDASCVATNFASKQKIPMGSTIIIQETTIIIKSKNSLKKLKTVFAFLSPEATIAIPIKRAKIIVGNTLPVAIA